MTYAMYPYSGSYPVDNIYAVKFITSGTVDWAARFDAFASLGFTMTII